MNMQALPQKPLRLFGHANLAEYRTAILGLLTAGSQPKHSKSYDPENIQTEPEKTAIIPPESGQTTNTSAVSATMWAIRHNLHFCAEIIEVALDESTQKDTFWVVPITETRELAHHQTFLSQRPDLFPTREAAVTEWVARLKKTTQSVVKELAKWSSTSDPTDAEILAWLLQKIRLFEWTFGTEVHYSLKATAERRFDDVEDIRGVVAQCINEKKGRFKQAPEGATML